MIPLILSIQSVQQSLDMIPPPSLLLAALVGSFRAVCTGNVPEGSMPLLYFVKVKTCWRKGLYFKQLFQIGFIYIFKKSYFVYYIFNQPRVLRGFSPPFFFIFDLTIKKRSNFLYEKRIQCCEHGTGIKAAFVFSVRWCLQVILTTVEVY